MGHRNQLLFVMSCTMTSVLAHHIGSHIPICARNTYHFSECIRNATVILRSYLATGISELQIPAIEPLKVPQIHLQQVGSEINYRNILTDVTIYGLSDYKFNTIRADVTKGRIEGDLNLPWLRIESRFNLSGNVICRPLEGSGFFNANITNSKALMVLKGHVVERNGDKYYDNTDTKLSLNIGSAMMNFENLMKSHPNPTMTTSMFLNENSNEMIKDLKPALETVAGTIINDLANKVFRSQPFDKLFPKI